MNNNPIINNEFVKIFSTVDKEINKIRKTKISIIGCGELGGTCLASLIYTQLMANFVLIEPLKSNFGIEKELFESFSYSNSRSHDVNMTYSNDILASANSDICIITFDCTRQRKVNVLSEALIYDNILNFYKYIPQIIKYSPNVILILLTYPFALFTQICYKIAKIPKNRIIGLGTSFLRAEFERLLAKRFNVSVHDVEAYVIGLDILNSKIPIWSAANVCGVALSNIVPLLGTDEDPLEIFNDLKLIELKRIKEFFAHGPPRWTIGLLCAKFCNSIIYDKQEVFVVPANLRGLYDIKIHCFISVPCSIGRNGIHSIICLNLNTKEKQELHDAARLSRIMLTHYIFETYTDKKILGLFH